MGMDLRSGKKLHYLLANAHLEDIHTTHVVVDTNNTAREAFARVIENWRYFSVYAIGESLQLGPDDQQSLLAGYEAQLRSIRNPFGYSSWGLVACSGSKSLH
jgi:hypothetical protein